MTVDTTNYTVNCQGSRDLASNTYGVGDTCTFTCGGEYYRHSGSTTRTCLHSEQWSGTLIDCRGKLVIALVSSLLMCLPCLSNAKLVKNLGKRRSMINFMIFILLPSR